MISLYSFIDELSFSEIPNFSVTMLAGVLADSSKFYRTFKIPKRSGGLRKIESPYPILSQIQRAILDNLCARCVVSDSAYAYIKDKNAIKHAVAHVNSVEVLTVDIKNFFGSITRQQVHEALLNNNIDNNFSHIISLVTTLNGTLPQGAPTSPFLSNIVFYPLDVRLGRLATYFGLIYTRYADDLAFSGESIPRNLVNLISNILHQKNFSLNSSKTMLKVKNSKKIITGVSISSGVPKAPRRFVRSLRAEIHYLQKNMSNLSSLSHIEPLIFEKVLGKLNYWLQIEPENQYAKLKKETLSEAHQNFLRLSTDFNLYSYLKEFQKV